jgi:hypothetical protein
VSTTAPFVKTEGMLPRKMADRADWLLWKMLQELIPSLGQEANLQLRHPSALVIGASAVSAPSGPKGGSQSWNGTSDSMKSMPVIGETFEGPRQITCNGGGSTRCSLDEKCIIEVIPGGVLVLLAGGPYIGPFFEGIHQLSSS